MTEGVCLRSFLLQILLQDFLWVRVLRFEELHVLVQLFGDVL